MYVALLLLCRLSLWIAVARCLLLLCVCLLAYGDDSC